MCVYLCVCVCVCVCVCIQYMRHCFGKKTTSTSISHSASYNITCNHHHHHHHSTNYNACIQYMWHRFRKKTMHHHCHHTVQVTILRPTTTAITSTTTAPVTMHAFSICATALGKKNRPPVQVTEGQKLHCHHWRARCSKHL